MSRKNHLMLSLSGGGLSSVAYFGFNEVLREHGLDPEMYAGLSGGAISAALLSGGYSAEQAIEFFNHLITVRILNWRLQHFEYLNHHSFTEKIREMLPYKNFEDLPVPAMIFATDMEKHQPVKLDSGDLASAIVASCSVFPLLQATRRNGLVLGDGGLTTVFGAQFLRAPGKSTTIVGVDVKGVNEVSVKGILSGMYRQMNSSIGSNAEYERQLHPVDVPILINFTSPPLLSFHSKARRIVAAGRKSGEKYLREIERSLDS